MEKRSMLFNKICVVISIGVFFLMAMGCSSNTEELKPGQCKYHSDCKGGGTKCNQGWCEDIYHPKRDIQPL